MTTDDEKRQAAEAARRAAAEGKEAIVHSADAMAEATRDNVHKLEGTAQDAMHALKGVKVSRDLSNMVIGVSAGLCLASASLFFGVLSVNILREAVKQRKTITS